MKIINLVDNTGSMGEAAHSARTSTQELQTMVGLMLGDPTSMRVAVYGDYDRSTPDNSCGGYSMLSDEAATNTKQQDQWFQKYMRPCGGGGAPEAQRTAFNKLLHALNERCIIFHITDALPHMPPDLDNEGRKEQAYLEANGMECDWDKLAYLVRQSHRVVTFLTRADPSLVNVYSKLGAVITLTENKSSVITQTLMKVLCALIGQPQDESIIYTVQDENGQLESCTEFTPELQVDLKAILKLARPETVLNAFESLLDPSKPEQALCLATNPVLGKYWRLICGRILNNPDFTSRSQNVIDRLSSSVAKLATTQQNVMKEWIEESHNNTDVVRAMVLDALPHCQMVLVLRGDPKVDVNDLLALGRGGGNFCELSKLIASIEVASISEISMPSNEDEAPNFVPLQGLKLPIHLFQLISNLIVPGILFSPSTAILAAILALNNKHLEPLATDLLTKKMGTWIDFSLNDERNPNTPTNYALNFIRILQLLPNKFLTMNEVQFRGHYLLIEKLVRNLDATLMIETGIIRESPKSEVTWKRLCDTKYGGCGERRCFTIFPGDANHCGLCLSGFFRKEQVPDKTYWAQCHNCQVNYGITAIDLLNVRPKCHYCRNRQPCPTVKCHLCQHKYVSQARAAEMAMVNAMKCGAYSKEKFQRILKAWELSSFVCPRCVENPMSMIQETEIKLSNLIKQNPKLKNLVPVSDYEALVDTKTKLWKRVLTIKSITTAPVDQNIELMWKNYIIHNPIQVAHRMIDLLHNASCTTPCRMCVQDTPLRLILEACGKCNNRICQNCVHGWYGQIEAGTVISRATTLCPFCKTSPRYDVIRNLAQAHIRNIRLSKKKDFNELCQWDSNMWHAVCMQCMNVKPFIEKICAAETPNLTNFVCDVCNAERGDIEFIEAKTQDCPGCGVKVEKAGGCNHITCPNCHEHWCWSCGMGGFDGHTVYQHMRDCAGIYPVDEADAGDDY